MGRVIYIKIWFGKVYHNICNVKILHIDESEVKDKQSTLIHHSYLQERIVYTLTNDIVATETTPLMGMINSEPENIQNAIPKVGDSIY